MKEMKEIIVPDIEILDDTPEEVKLDFFFKSLAKSKVEEENIKIELKYLKKDMKKQEIAVPALLTALKYLSNDGVNKKGIEADQIDIYMEELKKAANNEPNKLQGFDEKLKSLLEKQEDVKVTSLEIADKIGECGLDKKAIPRIVKEFIEENNPNKKVKEPDIVLESTIEKYDETLKNSKIEIIPIPIMKVE